MYYMLFYEKTKDFERLQEPYINAHREHVMQSVRQGNLALAGSLTNPSDGLSLLLFQSDDATTAEEFAKQDPYIKEGIVIKWYVRAWNVVAGTVADPTAT